MKKKIFLILLLFIVFLAKVNAVDTNTKIYDYNQSLTLNQENELRKQVLDFVEKNSIDMALITIKHYETKTVEEYVKEFYNKNKFGVDEDKSTIIYVLDYTDEPILEIFTSGKANDIYNDVVKEEIKESINLDSSSYKIFNKLINESKKYTNNYTDVSKYIVFNKISKNDYKIIAFISFLISTSVIIILILKSRIRKKKKTSHKKINLRMIKSVDKFLSTHTEAYRYGNKKGFTLIELLAVIVILAIIALIAVPIVINIISDSKYESQKRSIDLYAEALKQSVADYQLKNNKKVEGKFNTTDGKTLTRDDITLNVNYKGNVVCNRTIVNKDGSIYVGVCTVDGIKVDYEVGETTYGMIAEKKYKTEYGTEGVYARNFLNTSIPGYNIASFNLYDKINIPSGYESLDCSYNQDESVICYWKEISSNKYEMNIASDGEMYTPVDSSYLFYYLGYQMDNFVLDLTKLNTSKTINMSHMFNNVGYKNLVFTLGDKFDTSKVTDMSYMFKSSFKNYGKTFKLPDSFDTINVTNMEGMFSNAFSVDYYSPSYSSLILSDNFNTKNVTNMKSMFSNSLIKSIDLGNNFDTSKVTNMNCMFYGMGYITELNLGNKFDTGNVIDMSSMFNDVNKVTNLNFGKYFDTSKVTNMSNMFYGMKSLEKLTLKDEFNTSNVTNMEGMFSETRSLTELKLGKNFYTSKVTSMGSMFRNTGYNNLTHLDLGENFINGTTTDYYHGSYFSNMFEGLGHNSLVELNLRNFNPMTSYFVGNIFKDCGTEGVFTKIIVSSDSIKNEIKTDQRVNAPQFWKNNDWSIIQVQS